MAQHVSFSPTPPDAESNRRVSVETDNGQGEWSTERSTQRYQIQGWGAPYFHVNARGHVEVTPSPDQGKTINLFELTQDLKARGLELPLLIRFPDIVGHRIRLINEAFQKAIAEYEYAGVYRGVFPVKVNQQRHLVEEVVSSGRQWNFGLEAGSKPELLITLAAMQDVGRPHHLQRLQGLELHRDRAARAEVRQDRDRGARAFGRARHRAQGIREGRYPPDPRRARQADHQGASGAGRTRPVTAPKFGLTTSEMIEVVDRLTERKMLDCLQLLHFHIGSQISSIIPIKNAMQEASNIYVELAKLGAKMGYIDVGGGLAVDYDGSKTDFHASKNYQLEEYAADVVAHVQAACVKADVPVPTIVSESGRAVAAHHSILVFEVVGANEVRFGEPVEPKPDAHRLLKELFDTYCGIQPKNVQESYHDASQAKEEGQSLFKYGYLSLRERAQVERLYWNCCEKIHHTLRRLRFVPEELQHLEQNMSAIYYCNFSLFSQRRTFGPSIICSRSCPSTASNKSRRCGQAR